MKTLLGILSAFICSTVCAQNIEYRVAINSGLFHYSGSSAGSTTSVFDSDVSNEGFARNSFGSKNGPCYGLSLNIKRVARTSVFYGLDIGCELLQSKILIDTFYRGGLPSGGRVYGAEGRVLSKDFFYNVNPFFGYRFDMKKVDFDLAGGIDIAYCVFSKESGRGTYSDGIAFAYSGSHASMGFDFRPRVQLSAGYKRVGAYLGYSLGLSNYLKKSYNSSDECYARFFRFGLTYLLQ